MRGQIVGGIKAKAGSSSAGQGGYVGSRQLGRAAGSSKSLYKQEYINTKNHNINTNHNNHNSKISDNIILNETLSDVSVPKLHPTPRSGILTPIQGFWFRV